MTTKNLNFEIEDMIYGFQNYPELEPNERRINTLVEIMNSSPDKTIKEMIEIFKSGHGVLSKPDRIKALKGYLLKINTTK